MAVWLAFWTAAMLVAAWLVGGSLLRGEYAAAPFLLVWRAAAPFGLRSGLRRMRARLGLAPPPEPRPAAVPRVRRAGMPGRRDG